MSDQVKVSSEPIFAAVKSLENKDVVASRLDSKGWENAARDVRARSFFVSTVENVKYLSEAKKKISERLNLEQRNITGGLMDRAKFVQEMQALAENLGLRPTGKKRGGIQDVGSERRLRLIYDTQVKMSEGYAAWKAAQDPITLTTRPAWELIRVEDRNEPRDWQARWQAAGGTLTSDGRMVALINDEIWVNISRFKNPYPPFDFNSGMGIKTIRRREAVSLGLLSDGTDHNLAPAAQVPVVDKGFADEAAVGLGALTDVEAAVVSKNLLGAKIIKQDGIWSVVENGLRKLREYFIKPFRI